MAEGGKKKRKLYKGVSKRGGCVIDEIEETE